MNHLFLYSKYKVNHLYINPEYYSDSNQKLIRSLVLFEDQEVPPMIYTESIHSLLSKVIPKYPLEKVYLDYHFHMYLNKESINLGLPSNYVATQLYRLYSSNFYGIRSSETIYGPAVLCGSFHPKTLKRDGLDYSTPYEVVEQCLRIYETSN